MSSRYLCGCIRAALAGSAVMQMNNEEDDRSESSKSGSGPREIPASKPGPARRLCPWRW